MTPEVLARRLAALSSLEMRCTVLREHLCGLPAEVAASLLEGLVQKGRKTGPPYDVALMALVRVLEDPAALPYEVRADLYRAARAIEADSVSGLLLSELPTETGSNPSLPQENQPLTLGQRKALARRARGPILLRLMKDAHASVIRNVLSNPQLVERDVVAIAAMRPQHGDNLREIFRSRRFGNRPAVRSALVWNPHTPAELAKRLVPLLSQSELTKMAGDTSARPSLQHLAQTVLKGRAED